MQSEGEDVRRDAGVGSAELEEVRKLIRDAIGKLDQLID
jgi:hypothetical protein